MTNEGACKRMSTFYTIVREQKHQTYKMLENIILLFRSCSLSKPKSTTMYISTSISMQPYRRRLIHQNTSPIDTPSVLTLKSNKYLCTSESLTLSSEPHTSRDTYRQCSKEQYPWGTRLHPYISESLKLVPELRTRICVSTYDEVTERAFIKNVFHDFICFVMSIAIVRENFVSILLLRLLKIACLAIMFVCRYYVLQLTILTSLILWFYKCENNDSSLFSVTYYRCLYFTSSRLIHLTDLVLEIFETLGRT